MAHQEDTLRFIEEKDPAQWTDEEWEIYEAYIASLPEDDEAYDNVVLRERFQRMRGDNSGAPVVVNEGNPEELLARLRDSAIFWDDELKE